MDYPFTVKVKTSETSNMFPENPLKDFRVLDLVFLSLYKSLLINMLLSDKVSTIVWALGQYLVLLIQVLRLLQVSIGSAQFKGSIP